MGKALRTLFFLAIFGLFVSLVGMAAFASGRITAPEAKPTPMRVTQMGVVLTDPMIADITGGSQVAVRVSPDGYARKRVQGDYTEYQLPTRYEGQLGALTLLEAQEHTLRKLVSLPDGDYALQAVEPSIMVEMAEAPYMRVESPSLTFAEFTRADEHKTALTVLGDTAEHLSDNQTTGQVASYVALVEVAKSADRSQTMLGIAWPMAIFAVCAALIVWRLTGRQKDRQRENE